MKLTPQIIIAHDPETHNAIAFCEKILTFALLRVNAILIVNGEEPVQSLLMTAIDQSVKYKKPTVVGDFKLQ